MPAKSPRSRLRWLLAAVALAVIVGAAVAVVDPGDSKRPARRSIVLTGAVAPGASRGVGSAARRAPVAETGPCGAATAQTAAAVYVHVAKRIYAGEAGGSEVAEDIAHIAGSQELLSELAASDQPAVYAAVHTIVYTPHWHIVRLRVMKAGRVLADVGGPYIIAPVTGTLRQNGRRIGSFTMSVQDDLGYVKLITRFTGIPIDVYGTPHPPGGFVLGTLQPAPPLPRDGASVKVHGIDYLARVLHVRAFPNGPLEAVLLFASPSRSLSTRSCVAVRHAAWGEVLKHVAARFVPLAVHYQDLSGTLQGATGGLTFVRIGATQIAGLSRGPAHLPSSGPVRYRGQTWHVFSWEPYPPARIYFLAPS